MKYGRHNSRLRLSRSQLQRVVPVYVLVDDCSSNREAKTYVRRVRGYRRRQLLQQPAPPPLPSQIQATLKVGGLRIDGEERIPVRPYSEPSDTIHKNWHLHSY